MADLPTMRNAMGGAPIDSPAFTGSPSAPTPSAGDNSTRLATTAYLDSKLGVASGIATLNSSGKVTSSQLPSSITGGSLAYQGTWNAGTNSPAISSGVGSLGDFYKVSTAGTTTVDGISDWNIGDLLIFDGITWDKIDGLTHEVVSVAGRTGNVVLVAADISDATANGQALIKAANYAAMRTLLGLVPGTAANNLVQLDGSGHLPAVDGSALTNLPVGGLISRVQYTSSQTITAPAGASKAIVRMRGASGGSGSNTLGTGFGSQGGSAGGYLEEFWSSVTAGQTVVYTQGAGGVAGSGSVGGNGGTTTLASGTMTISTLTCNGGLGGYRDTPANGNLLAGGTASGGAFQSTGGASLPNTDSNGDSNASAGGRTGGLGGKGGDGVTASGNGTAGEPGLLVIEWYK